MRVIAAWTVLLVAGGGFIAMVISTWRHQARARTGALRNAVELAWSVIPWIIVALCVTPAAIGLSFSADPGGTDLDDAFMVGLKTVLVFWRGL